MDFLCLPGCVRLIVFSISLSLYRSLPTPPLSPHRLCAYPVSEHHIASHRIAEHPIDQSISLIRTSGQKRIVSQHITGSALHDLRRATCDVRHGRGDEGPLLTADIVGSLTEGYFSLSLPSSSA